MKKCPICHQVFDDDTVFCTNDGTTLILASGQQGFGGFQTSGEMPTQYVQRPQNTVAPAVGGSSNLLYLVIGILATALVGVGLYLFLSRDTEKRPEAINTNTTQPNTPAGNTPSPAAPINATANAAPPPVDPTLTPTGTWTGDWSGKSANFTARGELTETAGRVEGRIVWTLVRSSNPQKMYKAGSTAVEYVRGTFDPTTRMVSMAGYRKDDPSNIVILDRYNMSLSSDQRMLSGKSKNGVFQLRR